MSTAAPDLEALRRVVQQSAPVTLAREHTMPVLAELRPLFPEQGVRRGSTIAVSGHGASSLVLALSAEISRTGGWVAGIGVPTLGLTAAREAGVALERWGFVDEPGDQTAEVINAVMSGVDLVVLGPDVAIKTAHTRRLAARLRERGTSVVHLAPQGRSNVAPDLRLEITASRWVGLDAGHGRLRARRVEVTTTGRGAAARPRRVAMWMPGPDGAISVIERATLRPGRVATAETIDAGTPETGTVIDMTRRAG